MTEQMTYWECQRECEKMIVVRGLLALLFAALAALAFRWLAIPALFFMFQTWRAIKVRENNARQMVQRINGWGAS